MIWIFILYLIGALFTFFVFVYDDIKSRDLGVFDGFACLMLSMAWPFLWAMHLGYEFEDWSYKKI